MKPCTSLNIFFDPTFTVPIQEQMQRTYDAGFRHFDMNFWDYCASPASPFRQDSWKSWVSGIAEKAAQMGVRFTQAHAEVYNFYRDDAARRELYVRSLEGSAMLGIRWLVFHPSQRPDWESQPDDEQMIRENIEFFKPLAELGEKLGVGLALENMSHRSHGLTDAASLARLIDGLDSPFVGACWDTGHAHIAQADQAASIRLLGSRLHALHVQDNNGQRDQHTAPHYGTIDWAPLMQALRDIDYPEDFTFEAHNLIRAVPEGAKAAAAHLLYVIGDNLVSETV